MKRKSYYLSRLQSALRYRALQEKDEDKRSDYWRLYYKARNAEHEVREMVMDAEMRRLLEFVFPNGIPQSDIEEADKPDDEQQNGEKDNRESKPSSNEDDGLPKQRGLWE